MTALDRCLLETDLERLIALYSPEEIKVECAMRGEECIAMVRDHDQPRGEYPVKREYVIVRREDLDTMKRELVQFQRRWKELR